MTHTASTTDHDLKRAVVDELGWTPNVDADHLGVGVTAAVVTLSGEVQDYPAKKAAVSAALRVRGVAAVADEIAVRHSIGPRADSAVARDAADALATTVVVPPGSVRASVREHVVTLSGAVHWQYQRHAAEQAVAAIKSVRSVINDIVLEPVEVLYADDAKTNITRAMVRNARLDAGRVVVSIDGTNIRLTGEVASWAERHQAEYAGWSTPGVTHVDNQLTISSSA